VRGSWGAAGERRLASSNEEGGAKAVRVLAQECGHAPGCPGAKRMRRFNRGNTMKLAAMLAMVVAVVMVATVCAGQGVTDYGKQTNPVSGVSPAYEIRYLSVTGAGTVGDPYVMYFEDRNNSSIFTRVVSAGDYDEFPAAGTTLSGYSADCHPTVYEMSTGNWIMYSNNCPSVTDYSLSTDGGETWVGQGNLGLNTDNGAGVAAVYDDPIGGKVHFWYQDGGGNLLYCNSGTATGDARFYSPDGTTEIVGLAKTESGYATGFSPTGGIAVLPSGEYGLFLVAQDDSGVQLASSATLGAGAGSWTFLFDHGNPLLPGADGSLTPARDNLKECSITDLGGGIFGIHYDGEFGSSDESYGYATVDLNAPVHNLTQLTDHWTIQAAIDAANPGDEIQADAGVYPERVNVHTAVDLRGAQYGVDPTGAGARTNPAAEAIIDASGLPIANPHVTVEIPSGVTNVSVSGFTLIGVPLIYHSDDSIVRCWDDDITVSDNIMDGYSGVVCKGAANQTVHRNRMVVNKNAVVVQPNPGMNVTVSDNHATLGPIPAGDESAFYMTGCTQVSITGNTVSGFVNGKAATGSSVDHITISGNAFDGNKDAISYWGTTTFVTIADNTITNSLRFGVSIKGQDITISGNEITGSADSGVNIDRHAIDTERVTARTSASRSTPRS